MCEEGDGRIASEGGMIGRTDGQRRVLFVAVAIGINGVVGSGALLRSIFEAWQNVQTQFVDGWHLCVGPGRQTGERIGTEGLMVCISD